MVSIFSENQIILWVAELGTLLSLLLIARKKRVGWTVGFLVQIVWLVYALDTRQIPFVVAVFIYAIVNAHGWLHWNKVNGTIKEGKPALGATHAGPDEQPMNGLRAVEYVDKRHMGDCIPSGRCCGGNTI